MTAARKLFLGAGLTLALCPGNVWAQQASQGSSTSAAQQATKPEQKTRPAAAKSPKVWTDEDVSSLRTPEDNYLDQERVQAAEVVTKPAQPAPAKSVQPAAPAAFSNPKTVEDADKMIAWEQRDIQAQQDFIDGLKKQLDQAPADQKERLQNLLQQHIQNLATTQKEMQGIAAQKDALQKPAKTNSSAPGQPQSQ